MAGCSVYVTGLLCRERRETERQKGKLHSQDIVSTACVCDSKHREIGHRSPPCFVRGRALTGFTKIVTQWQACIWKQLLACREMDVRRWKEDITSISSCLCTISVVNVSIKPTLHSKLNPVLFFARDLDLTCCSVFCFVSVHLLRELAIKNGIEQRLWYSFVV